MKENVFVVLCSCGKANTVQYDKASGEYICEGWQLRQWNNLEGLPMGWYCGQKTHYQIGKVIYSDMVEK